MQYLAYLQMKKILPQEWKETIHSWCDCVLMDGMLGISACIHDVTINKSREFQWTPCMCHASHVSRKDNSMGVKRHHAYLICVDGLDVLHSFTLEKSRE
jgi:hypothetical protein